MKKKQLWLFLLGALPLFANSTSGEAIFDTKCAICHIKTKPTAQIKASLIAPPAMGVMFNLKKNFNNDKEATLAFMRDYIVNPSAKKAKCLPQAINRFGVMPSQKELLTPEELVQVTEYMYDTFPLKGFAPIHR